MPINKSSLDNKLVGLEIWSFTSILKLGPLNWIALFSIISSSSKVALNALASATSFAIHNWSLISKLNGRGEYNLTKNEKLLGSVSSNKILLAVYCLFSPKFIIKSEK